MLPRCRTIDAHAEGGPLRLLVEGVPPLQGATLDQRAAFAANALEPLRQALCREPRGHRDLVVSCLTVPDDPLAHAALLFLGADGLIPWCGHGAIAALTIAVERGLVLVASEPRVAIVVESLAGAREVTLTCAVPPDAGVDCPPRVASVCYAAGPAGVVEAGRPITCAGRAARVDLVLHDRRLWAVFDAETAGVPLGAARRELARDRGLAWFEALQESLSPAEGSGLPLEALVLTGPPASEAAHLRALSVFGDGSLDISPGGGATVAIATVLAAMGVVTQGEVATVEGVAGGRFEALVDRLDPTSDQTVADVRIAGRAWITGEHLWHFQADDPLRAGQGE